MVWCHNVHVAKSQINWTICLFSTGLDPAGPMFDDYPLEASLNPDCASFVDILHTQGKGGIVNIGSLRVLGHMDFYPNGGGFQPGCDISMLIGRLTGDHAIQNTCHLTEELNVSKCN